MRRQGGSAFTANQPQVSGSLCGVWSAITKLAGPTAGLAGCQVCGAGVRLLGVPTSLAVGSGQLLSEKQKAQPAREESPGFSWGRSQQLDRLVQLAEGGSGPGEQLPGRAHDRVLRPEAWCIRLGDLPDLAVGLVEPAQWGKMQRQARDILVITWLRH